MTPPDRKALRTALELQWFFSWRRRTPQLAPLVLPVVIVTLGFGVLLAVVQVRVAPPQFEMERQGSLVYLPATGDGLAWAIRAKEAGPMLSRYEPSTWGGYPAMAQSAIAATRLPLAPHIPQLQGFPPAVAVPPLPLATAGEPVFPQPQTSAAPVLPPVVYQLAPVLYPLSPMVSSALPQELPPVPADLDPKIVAADWRSLIFLVRLHPDGGVADSLALNKIPGPGPAQLENWLRGVTFAPNSAAQGDWLAVGIRFINHPTDGADNH